MNIYPILLLGLSGLLVGGVISMRQQGAGKVPMVVVGALALLALAGGVLWMVGDK